jgi:predicted nucleic acid-binding protein
MAKQKQQVIVVLDNTVLTNYSLVNRADLVIDLWPGIASITPDVLTEYTAGVQAAGLPANIWDCLPVLTLTASEIALALGLSHRLGAGERSCLAVAISRGALFATDDEDARRHVKRTNIPVVGTVGILIRNIQQNRLSLSDAQSCLDTMISAGYRSPISRLDDYGLITP